MKKFIFFARVYTWLLFIIPFSSPAQNLDEYPNYVVIGAFEHQKNAVFFTDDANQHKFPAQFEMNPNRNLYYVYVLTTDDKEYAFAEALKLRTDTKYFDTWVFSGPLGQSALPTARHQDQDFNPATRGQIQSIRSGESAQEDGVIANTQTRDNRQPADGQTIVSGSRPDTGNEASEVKRNGDNGTSNLDADESDPSLKSGTTSSGKQTQGAITRGDGTALADRTTDGPQEGKNNSDNATENSSGQLQNLNNSSDKSADGASSSDPLSTVEAEGNNTTLADVAEAGTDGVVTPKKKGNSVIMRPPPKRVSTEPLTAEEVKDKDFYFYLYRADNRDMIGGEVDAVDFEKSRRMATYEANAPVKVIMPSGKSKQISFVCQVFGYRKLQKEFDPFNPSADLYLDDKGNLVVPFELMRLQKGDIAIMYNVFFFKDAAVMRPESRYEVNNLLELLEENPTYKIKIHGHTNGNAAGKIIFMDKPGNFYTLSDTRQGAGSAKKLSEERAMVIREYLISGGISRDRMNVEAWGGKKPIHDKHSSRAHENVRVEIEILSE